MVLGGKGYYIRAKCKICYRKLGKNRQKFGKINVGL